MTNALEANIGLNTDTAQASINTLANLTDAQMKRIAGFVRQANKEMQDTARYAKEAANTDSYARMAEGAEKVRAGHAGVNRELLVLTHELSQGNFSRFGGSMLVLAERTNALEFAMTGAGAATLAFGGAVLGTFALIAQGAIEADRFAKALQLTGNYAAITEDQVRSLAETQSKQTGQTVGSARESIQTVASTGLFGPNEVAAASRAMGDYQRLTHATSEDAIKDFAALQNGVAKWAEETNRSVHFLSSAEYERIKALEDSGQKQQAAIEALTQYAQTIESRAAPQLGALSNAFHEAGQSASFLSEAIKNIGRGATPEGAIGGLQRDIDQLQSQREMPGSNDRYRAAIDSHVAQLQEAQRQIRQEVFKTSEFASQASANAAAQQAAIDSDKYVDGILRGAKALSQRTEELKKWDGVVAAHAVAGNPLPPKDIAAGRAVINKRYEDHGAIAQANEYANLVAQINAFNKVTDEQTAKQGKLTDAEQWGIRMAEDLEKAHRKLSAAQEKSIQLMAWAAEAKRFDAEIAAQIKPENTPEQKFRQSEIQAQPGVDSALREAQLADDRIRHMNQAQLEFNDSFSNGYLKASKVYTTQAANNAAYAEQAFNDTMRDMEGDLEQFEKTGKLSIKSMIDSWITDFLRFENQKFLAGAVGGSFDWGGGSSPLKYLGGLGADSSSGATGTFGDLFSGEFGGGYYANGLDYVPYDNFPAMLHKGEQVVRAQDASMARSRDAMHFDFSGASYSFGEGVSSAQVAQAVKAGNQQLEAKITRSINTGRLTA